MKTLLWAFTALIATAWTGAVALAVQLTEWAIAELGSGRLNHGAWDPTPWPTPAWMSLWVDPVAVQALQAALMTAWAWMAEHAPRFTGVLDWLPPLMWAVWGLVVLCLLSVAGLLHWLFNRGTSTPPTHTPNQPPSNGAPWLP